MNSVRDGKENPALANNNIRKALAQAFDKESFVKEVLQDQSTATDQVIPRDKRLRQMEQISQN